MGDGNVFLLIASGGAGCLVFLKVVADQIARIQVALAALETPQAARKGPSSSGPNARAEIAHAA